MPRMTTGETSAFTQVQTQARELLAKLRTDIRTKDAELRRLRQEESKLAALTGQPSLAVADSKEGRAHGQAGQRMAAVRDYHLSERLSDSRAGRE